MPPSVRLLSLSLPVEGDERRVALAAAPEFVSDVALMERIALADAHALELLLHRYWSPLLGYVTRLLGTSDGAQDIVQEVFVTVWEKRLSWRPIGSVPAFMYRICRNLALNERRSWRIRAAWFERRSASLDRSAVCTPLQSTEEHELEHAIEAAITRLSPRRREVFVLARYHGLPYKQIATVMGISPQTVANQMTSALADLRAVLAPFMDAR